MSDDDTPGTPPGPGFNGLRLYRDLTGALAVMLFQDGHITELEPNDNDRSRALGCYDLSMKPVPDPTEPAGGPQETHVTDVGKTDAITASLQRCEALATSMDGNLRRCEAHVSGMSGMSGSLGRIEAHVVSMASSLGRIEADLVVLQNIVPQLSRAVPILWLTLAGAVAWLAICVGDIRC